jgi:hypothetical protein
VFASVSVSGCADVFLHVSRRALPRIPTSSSPPHHAAQEPSPYMDMPGAGVTSTAAPGLGDQPIYASVKKRGKGMAGVANPLYSLNSTADSGEYMEASAIAPSIAPHWMTEQTLEDGYMDVTGAGRVQADGDHDDRGYLDVRAHPGGAREKDGDAYFDVTGAPADNTLEDVGYTDISGEGPLFTAPAQARDDSAEDVGYVEFAGQKDQEEEATMA